MPSNAAGRFVPGRGQFGCGSIECSLADPREAQMNLDWCERPRAVGSLMGRAIATQREELFGKAI
jgi:hypothetical protein